MPTTPAWRLRDTFAAAALFLATAAFTLWQNGRVAVLFDLSYLLDTSYRISLGQIPYRDFPFAHAPLTFVLHAAIIHIFGRVYFPHVVCAALEAGAATLLTWRILLKFVGNWPLALLLATPLITLGIYGIYPHPEYDCDAILTILVALYLLQRAGSSALHNAIAGAVCVLPIFFKQNIGLAFLFITLAASLALAAFRRRQRLPIAPQLWLLGGAVAAVAGSLLAVHAIIGLHNFIYWTITYARQRRQPGLSTMLEMYRQTSLRWTIPTAIAALALLYTSRQDWHPERSGAKSKDWRVLAHTTNCWTRLIATFLLAAPFLWTILSLPFANDISDRADQLLSLWPHLLLLSIALAVWKLRPANLTTNPTLAPFLPLILVATIHGTFLSQQLWGSTYAIWPLLTLLIAALLTQIPAVSRPVAITIAATFLICGTLYATSHERLSYVHLADDSATERPHATLHELRGLTTPGPWIPAFEELVRVTDAEIPATDGILLIPGEDPFYFATGRIPQMPFLMFDHATAPYSAQQTVDLVHTRNIRWLILNRDTQLIGPSQPDIADVTQTLLQDFTPYRTLTNYAIYHRK